MILDKFEEDCELIIINNYPADFSIFIISLEVFMLLNKNKFFIGFGTL